MKTCRTCGVEKPLEEFYAHAGGAQGRRGECILCFNKKDALRKRGSYDATSERVRKTLKKFNLSPEKYEEMYAAQEGLCAICRGTNLNGKSLAIDHDHMCCNGNYSCGDCVRGLLCFNCNFVIGHAKDDVDILMAAVAYLIQYDREEE